MVTFQLFTSLQIITLKRAKYVLLSMRYSLHIYSKLPQKIRMIVLNILHKIM